MESEVRMIDIETAKQILLGDDTDPNILQSLGLEILDEVKRLQNDLGVMSELLVEAAHCIHEMEGMAYAEADPDDFAKHAMEFRGNVSTTIGNDAPWSDEE